MRSFSMYLSKAFLVAVATLGLSSPARSEDDIRKQINSIPASGNVQNGNHITLNTDAFGLKAAGSTDKEPLRCAPAGSELTYIRVTNDQITVYFRSVAPAAPANLADRCRAENVVGTHLTYTTSLASFDTYYYHANGVVFGGLVVPFKFRMGGVNELVSSATVAPYVGWNFDNITHGLSFSPVASAGIALVPVADPVNKTTTSKAAFSAAVGFVITSSKNQDFHAGLIAGKDFASRGDRDLDPALKKMWISLYLGYKL